MDRARDVGGDGMVTRHSARYNATHRALRRALLPGAVGSPCVRCGQVIAPGEPIDLDHRDDAPGWAGMAHASCNRRAGAMKGAQSRARKGIEMSETAFGIDTARDRSRTAVVSAGWAQHPRDGRVIAARLHLYDGSTPLDEIATLAVQHDPKALALNGVGTMRSLAVPLAGRKLPVKECTAADMVAANAALVDALRDRLVRIPEPDPALEAAVRFAAVRDLTEGQAVDKRRSEADLAPLVALELAVWALLSIEAPRPPRIWSWSLLEHQPQPQPQGSPR